MLLKIPILKGVGFVNLIPDYERWMSKTLLTLLDDGSWVFIDVGANTGQSLLRVLPYYPKIQYFAIEPNPFCTKYLVRLCQLNKFNNVKVFNKAFSERSGETELQLRFDDDILATTTASFRKFTRYSNKIKVPMIEGDSLLEEENLKGTKMIIKIDVEGGESKVINGMIKTIKAYRPIIICEILPLRSKDPEVESFRISSAKEILLRLKEIGYDAINLHSKKAIQTTEDISTSLKSSNYLFHPSEISPGNF